ncbi:uncharacterized protein isoform X2 [Choristoneura fumiferana]|uniref:uncharacterized protein isoform X2 n=1 Tax=Choristoneura fumiferana TaxID=7141 RepID=UPI003D157CCD
MPLFKMFPDVDSCCGCVTDLKTAAAIICVIAIITSPVVAWSLIRHSYAVRVACYVTTASNRVDVLDLTLNNIVSFGFGVNAGLGPSCMTRNSTSVLKQVLRTMQDPADSEFIRTTKYFGWVVMSADIILVIIKAVPFIGYSVYVLCLLCYTFLMYLRVVVRDCLHKTRRFFASFRIIFFILRLFIVDVLYDCH